MKYIGFAACLALLFYATVISALWCVNCLGKYNIGGVPNTLIGKLSALLLVVVMLYGWWLVFHFAPFTISFQG